MPNSCIALHIPRRYYSVELYLSQPNFSRADVNVATLFGLTAVLHLIQAIHYRKKFCWVIIMAALWETTGFVLRILTIQHQTNISLGPAFNQPSVILILLAPLWVNAFDYMVLGRMVYYFVPEKKLFGIRAQRLAMCFVLLDISAFLLQITGALLANSNSDNEPNAKIVELGLHIYMGGIGLQEFFICIFVFLAIRFHRKMWSGLSHTDGWQRLTPVLYATLGLITIRVIYRLAEYSQGIYSSLTEHEVYFYVFEATPMFSAFILWNIWHPGQTLIGPDSEFPKKEKEKKSKMKKDNKKGMTIELEGVRDADLSQQ